MRMQKVRQYLLVSEMMGAEGHVCVDFILMIANLQSLGVPLVLTSLPIVFSATISLLLIPALGYINVRCAITLKLKAITLVAVNCVQLTGGVLVLLGNLLKAKERSHIMTNTTGPSLFNESIHTMQNESGGIPIRDFQHAMMTTTADIMDFEQMSSGLKPYAIMALVGYAMVDSGYDMSSCFLKTFALASTPAKDHPSVIVKAIVVSSLGGCLVALLGSVGIGRKLASATGLDANAVISVFLFGLCLVIMIPTMVMSLIAGLYCSDHTELMDNVNDDDDSSSDYDETKDENQSLITESIALNATENMDGGSKQWYTSVASDMTDDLETPHHFMMSSQSSITREVVEKVWQLSQSGAFSLMEQSLSNVRTHYTSLEIIVQPTDSHQSCADKIRSLFEKQEKRILLCVTNFFAIGAVFSFNMYSVNFVATSIFKGDATAPIDSEEYANYSEGVKAGSTGLMLCYSAFVVATLSQAFLLNKIGWWKETVIVFLSFIVSLIFCATTKLLWVYYVTACLNGIYRAVVYTVPYILVCRVIAQDAVKSGKSDTGNSWDIALVAAMLPLSMALYSPIMGPMLEGTGDSASPLYFTAASSTIGLALFSFLRNY